MIHQLKPAQIRKSYDPNQIHWDVNADRPPEKILIGQKRALRALQFGLGNKASGFNIYVSGMSGDGKAVAIRHFLENLAQKEETPGDWCYVNNFDDSYCPKVLHLQGGGARKLKEDVNKFIEEAHNALMKAFDSEEYSHRQQAITNELQRRENQLFFQLNQKAKKDNFIIQRTAVQIMAIPLMDGKPMGDKEFHELSEKEQTAILQKQRGFQDDINLAARKSRELEKESNEKMMELEQFVSNLALKTLVEELCENYKEQEDILTHIDVIRQDVLDNLGTFLQPPDPKAPPAVVNHLMKKYDVHVLVDNSGLKGAPIVWELNPTYNNLFGRIEKESYMGTLITDFTLIRSGALHEANGGYLVIPVEELLRNYSSWDSLKRALRNKRIGIEDAGEKLGFVSAKSIKPNPIPLNTQVVLIGKPQWYYLLYERDDDFRSLFKVKADFDTSMEASKENLEDFVTVINYICRKDKLFPLDQSGMVKIMEYGHRLADSQDKISTRLGEIGDLIKEAHHYAVEGNSEAIGSEQVRKAIREKFYRGNLMQEKINDLIRKDVIFIDLEGEKVGQVNGIAVLSLGDIAFGRPSRITVSVSVGKSGVMDIEREVKMGGSLHSKGVLILSGFLKERFAQNMPISLSAQLVFEQNYSGVDGDSASSTELYALLSNLADLPIRQGIGVTGSVNQKGEVQAIGGVNEKIEGFFEVCKCKGINGQQGVMIPKSNVQNLMLNEEIVEAVENGQFHLYAVEHVDEGIEVLTGVKAGKGHKNEDGEWVFEENSVNERVSKRLKALTDTLMNYGKEEKEEGEEEKEQA